MSEPASGVRKSRSTPDVSSGSFRFEDFVLDPHDRLLRRGEAPVELNARYLDALVPLVREQGKLVSKDSFLAEVWRGVPVTDEALNQCIRTLRRQLGDDATSPRFIESVPKHGYRYIALVRRSEVETDADASVSSSRAIASGSASSRWRSFFLLGGAGTVGGGVAGILVGLFYGFAGAPNRFSRAWAPSRCSSSWSALPSPRV